MSVVPWLVASLLVVALGACVSDPSSFVLCDELVAADDCDRAVTMAEPLMGDYWENASRVLVHPGMCHSAMLCSGDEASDPSFLTVELVPEVPKVFVLIDRHDSAWTADCLLYVSSLVETHTEPCPQAAPSETP